MTADPLFACGLVRAREERLLTRADLLRLVADASWEEAEQVLDRTGFTADPQGSWRRAPREWAARVVADEAREVGALLPDGLAPFPWLGIEAHNLGLLLCRLRGDPEPPGGLLPGGRIDQQSVADGIFPEPWDRDGELWLSLRDREADHPLGTAAACRIAAAGYRRTLLGGSASPALATLGERLEAATLLGILLRARRQGRPWSAIAPQLTVPPGLGGEAFEAVYPLPPEEWGGPLGEPWDALVAAAAGRGDAVWDALAHEICAPALADARAEDLSVAPVIAWFVQRELQARIAGFALEAKAAGLGQDAVEAGVPRVLA